MAEDLQQQLRRTRKKSKRRRRRGPNRVLRKSAYYAVLTAYHLARITPMWALGGFVRAVANLAFLVLTKRRRIAIDNIRHALGDDLGYWRVLNLARRSFESFLLAPPELIKHRSQLLRADAREWMLRRYPDLGPVFQKVKDIHEASGGCIFVTPHFGNWELLPFVSAAFGIPTVIPVRPLDNPYLEQFVYAGRAQSGQIFVPNRNSLHTLQQRLDQGDSVGLLPDQSTKRGLLVEFFGRPALTTPIPATLAIMQQRPIVVIACYRTGRLRFDGYASDPIWPRPGQDQRQETERLCLAMNREMEKIIRLHPEQYFWMHNRWKRYQQTSRRERRGENEKRISNID